MLTRPGACLEDVVSTSDQERKNGSDDEAVLQLAQRLAPKVSDMDADGPVPFRKSGPGSFFIFLLFVAALMPSLGLAMIALSNPELKKSMWTETSQAAEMVAALPSILGGTNSGSQNSQTDQSSVSADVTMPQNALASTSRSRNLSTREQAVVDDVLAPPSGDIDKNELLGGETASLSPRFEAAEKGFQLGFDQAAEPEHDVGNTTALEGEPGSRAFQLTEAPRMLPVEIDAAGEDSAPSLGTTDANSVGVSKGDVDDREAELVLRPEELARVGSLMAHGHKMIDVGYFAGARAYFKRAVEAGSGEAALALGATYDPQFIKEIGAHGIEPEPEEARLWYSRARLLGAVGADAKLAALEVGAVSNVLPQVRQPPAPSEEQKTTSLINAGRSDLETPETWVQPAGAVNLRTGPSPDSEATQVIRSGTKLRVIADEESWFHVIDPDTGKTGWVYSKAVETTAAPDPKP